MSNRLPILLSCVLALAGGAAQAGGLYKWTDADGNVVFSDKPPPAREAASDKVEGYQPLTVKQAIEQAVTGLSDKLRVVFVLARYRGLPYAEISQILDIPVGTVKSRMSLAEQQLRRALERYLEEC